MKVIFVVQGEGRGHMTQAISLKEILDKAGHEVMCCLIGQLKGEENNYNLLKEQLSCPVKTFASPNIYYSKKTGHMSLVRTITNGILHFGRFFSNLRVIKDTVDQYEADVVINFYDLLGGFYNMFLNHSKVPFIAVAHQYFLSHKSFDYPVNQRFNKMFLMLNSAITSFMADKVLALSFKEEQVRNYGNKVVMPPLIRERIKQVQAQTKEDYILAYCSQPYMVEDLMGWSKDDDRIKCYTSSQLKSTTLLERHNIELKKIHPETFLMDMLYCDQVFTTSGFESICEAGYLGKKITIVPMRNHYEQLCNAHDAERVGIAFRMSKDAEQNMDIECFRNWVDKSPSEFLREIKSTIVDKRRPNAIKKLATNGTKSISLAILNILKPFYPSCRPTL